MPDNETPAAPEPTGPPIELAYLGDEGGLAHVAGVPAADLTSTRIDRLVYVRTIPEAGSPGLQPGDKGFTEKRREIVDELVDSGLYGAPGRSSGDAPKPTKKQLLARAAAVGVDVEALGPRPTNEAISEAIAQAEAANAAAAEGGSDTATNEEA